MFQSLFAGVPDRPQRTPALETRLKNELSYILQAPYWKSALKLLADLDALTCLHPSLKLNQALWRQLRLVDRYSSVVHRHSSFVSCPSSFVIRHSSLDEQLGHDREQTTDNKDQGTKDKGQRTMLLLETLIAYLADPYRSIVAHNLQCSLETIERLEGLQQRQMTIVQELQRCDRPSQVVQRLMPYDIATLVLVGIRSSRPVRKLIWRYLSHWSHIKPPLDGNDLRALGYRPGRQFRQMLDDLVVAVLDGTIVATTAAEKRQQAEQFLKAHYPPPIP
jgi:tRNA nucleotidyltransferase (CCA-adding enzyme)